MERRMAGFQKRIRPREMKSVGLAIIRYASNEHVECSCGWVCRAHRAKVAENAIDRHLAKRHQGKGIRL